MDVQSWKRIGDGLIVQSVTYNGKNIREVEDFVDFGKLSLQQKEPYMVTISGRKPLTIDDYVVKYPAGDIEILTLNEICDIFNLIQEGTDEDEVPVRHMVEDEQWLEVDALNPPTADDEGGD